MNSQRILIAIAAVILLALTYQLWLADDGYQEVRRLEQEISEQKLEVETKRQRNRELEAEVKDLKNGVDAVEERARNELGMTKKNETFVQIVDDEPEISPDP